MRKFIVSILITSSLVCFGPAVSSAGDWETYLEVNDRYYFLDDKEFAGITCRVEVPVLSNALNQAKERLGPFQSKVSIEENLKDFKLTYDPVNGLSFIKPILEAKILSTEDVPDPEGLRRGADMLNIGFKTSVAGAEALIKNVFLTYQKPNKKDTDLVSITGTKDPIEIRYSKDGITNVAVVDGDSVNIVGRGEDVEGKAEYTYIKIKGKYVASEMNYDMKRASTRMTLEAKIGYQDVGDITFPQKIETKQHLVMDNLSQKMTMDVSLTDCEMK